METAACKLIHISFDLAGTGVWNFHSTESSDVLEITTSNAKILLPDFLNGRQVSVKSPDGTVLEEWVEAPPSTVQLPMIQSVSWLQMIPSLNWWQPTGGSEIA